MDVAQGSLLSDKGSIETRLWEWQDWGDSSIHEAKDMGLKHEKGHCLLWFLLLCFSLHCVHQRSMGRITRPQP